MRARKQKPNELEMSTSGLTVRATWEEGYVTIGIAMQADRFNANDAGEVARFLQVVATAATAASRPSCPS